MVDFGVKPCVDDLDQFFHMLCMKKHVKHAQEFSHSVKVDGANSYSIFIQAFCVYNDLSMAYRVLDSMKRHNLMPNVFTYNRIMKKLCKNNDKVDEAYELLDEMIQNGTEPDTLTYNTMLYSHCDLNEVNRALMLLSRMDQRKCLPNAHTYNMLLKMLIRIGRFDRIEEVWLSMEKRGFYPSESTYSVMVHGLCNTRGKLDEALKYFEIMIEEGLPPFTNTCEYLRNKLIKLGYAELTEILADKMERSSSPSIQEAAAIMRGNRVNVRSRNGDEDSDYSDN